jgi:hypothetical protein
LQYYWLAYYALLACSHEKPEPYLVKNGKPLAGSISEKKQVDINGIKL